MRTRRDKALVWLLVLLALTPALFYAYLGQFSRLISDDFSKIAVAREYGVWDGMLFWRAGNTGSYSYTLLHGWTVPLDTVTPPVVPALLIALCLGGLAWLLAAALSGLGVKRDRAAIALALAGLTIGAAIYAFYIPHTFFWYSANSRYVLPVGLFILSLALARMAATNFQRARPWLPFALASGLCCFVAGGFAEMAVLAQWTAQTLLIFFGMILLDKGARRGWLASLGVGWLATCLSMFLIFTAPSASLRMERNAAAAIWQPMRTLPDIFSGSIDLTFQNLGHQTGFAGFMLLLAVALALTLRLYQPAAARSRPGAMSLQAAPLWLGLTAQVGFIPILWSHTSDYPQFLGRFSFAFATVLCLNAALTTLFALLLWRRDRFGATLNRRDSGWLQFIGATLAFVAMLFAMTQLRSIHYKAATFLFLTALVCILALCWQFAHRRDRRVRCCGLGALLCFAITVAVILALAAASLYTQGNIQPRIMAPVAFLQVAGGLFWGGWLGMALRESPALAGGGAVWTVRISRLCMALALVIGLMIVNWQVNAIPNLSAFAAEWDGRHKLMLSYQASGRTDVPVPELSVDISEFFCCSNTTSAKSASFYYGFASPKLLQKRE